MTTKVCPVCGKMFELAGSAQIYCSHDCKNRKWRLNHPRVKKVCRQCGGQFVARSNSAVYCMECRDAKAPAKDRDRKHTPDTAYLCQKWHREGMSARQIADILRRSAGSVRKALAVPLAPEEYHKMEEYRR